MIRKKKCFAPEKTQNAFRCDNMVKNSCQSNAHAQYVRIS